MLALALNRYGKPLMPYKPQKTKMLFKASKAKVVRRSPYVIKLNNGTSGHKQRLAGGQDSGSKVIGSGDAAVIASGGKPVKLLGQALMRQIKGMRLEKPMPTGKLFGLKKFDRIQTSQGIGFVKGRRASGYFPIGDMLGKPTHNAVKVKTDITRLSTRNITLTAMENFASTMRCPPQGVSIPSGPKETGIHGEI